MNWVDAAALITGMAATQFAIFYWLGRRMARRPAHTHHLDNWPDATDHLPDHNTNTALRCTRCHTGMITVIDHDGNATHIIGRLTNPTNL